ncbi:MAG: GDSL-type esterase/lipase family protein, partial [Phycisphaeraceae bacterium]
DAGRNRNAKGANDGNGHGRGYPFLISSYLLAVKPDLNLQTYNRGNSGNKVPDLDKRWDEDCINLKPNVLSILIGVNDIWHKLNGNYDGTVETYEKGFAALLERTRKALPETKIVICEPFVLKCGAVNDKWFPEFDLRKAAAKRVAQAAGAIWVPFQEMFDEAVKTTKPNYWAGDGVHPSMAGHALMAKLWIETVCG